MGESVSVRELALYAMIEIAEKKEYSNRVLGDIMEKYQYLDKKDRAFCYRLCEGTLENLIRIDEILDRFSSVKARKMKPVIRNILRLGVYQLLFMDSVPDSAACNESVKLAVKKGFGKLRGFVNGVLRNIARNKENALLPGGIGEEEYRKKDLAGYLSVRYSMPAFLVNGWLGQYPADVVERMLASFQESTPLTARVNLARAGVQEVIDSLNTQGVSAKVHPYLPYALILEGVDYLGKLDAFRDGLFTIQDISSMLVGRISGVKPGDLCVDVCAAPGGKSLHAADLLMSSGLVISRDLTPDKVDKIDENIRRCGFANMKTQVWDALEFDPELEGKADVVIADLPCSGLGVMGRKVDIRYQASQEGMDSLAALQLQILDVVWRYVKPGGTLIYSTCTVNRAENEDNLNRFLNSHPFKLVSIAEELPECITKTLGETSVKNHPGTNGMNTAEDGYLQLLPGICEGDGFFISKMVRVD